jgi:hypothetical protein
MTSPFNGIESSDLGVQASDIVTAGLDLVVVLAPILLLTLAIAFAPKVISLIRGTNGKSKNN